MKYKSLIGIMLFASVMQAKDVKAHESGTLLQMESVQCGYDENTGKSIAGELLGTDSAHKKTHAVLCQKYVVQSEKITYRIRPRDEKRPVLLPVGERAQFRMDKDKMKLRVEDLARGSNNLSSRLEGWSATEAGKIGGTIMTKVLIAPKTMPSTGNCFANSGRLVDTKCLKRVAVNQRST